jgi:hypothetical protein
VVEHSIGNGEVDSSILSGSTINRLNYAAKVTSLLWGIDTLETNLGGHNYRRTGCTATVAFFFPRQLDRHNAPKTSVVAGNRLAGVQTLSSILRPPLRLGNLRQVHVDLLVWNAVEQMADQV